MLPEAAFTAVEFVWNCRHCTGHPIHDAVRLRDLQAMKRLLDEDPTLLTKRFTYETVAPWGAHQEGSGECLHLAVSRGYVLESSLLLERRADLGACVTRDGKQHFDVLHAACSAEGRGGSAEMVEFLLAKGAPITMNADKKWPIHIAWQTGKLELMDQLFEAMATKGIDWDADDKVDSPLLIGIKNGNLTAVELAEHAPLTSKSLSAFILHEPASIPSFLQRMLESGKETPADIAALLTPADLTFVLRANPAAADALLTAITGEPSCEHRGWHPLPSRVSYEPRDWFERNMLVFLNGNIQRRVCYREHAEWRFDAATFHAPLWHVEFKDRSLGRQQDADIKVCYLPNIISAELFFSLVKDADGAEVFYNNSVIRSVIDYTWWNGAYKLDLALGFLSLWGVVLMCVELYYYRWQRVLDHSHLLHVIEALTLDSHPDSISDIRRVEQIIVGEDHKHLPVLGNFMGAQGIVDLGMKLLQLAGVVSIGRTQEYLTFANLLDLWKCILPMFFLFVSGSDAARTMVIVLYWARLLGLSSVSENIMTDLLPVLFSYRGLGPVSLVTLMCFGMFMQIFYAANTDPNIDFKTFFHDVFGMLVTSRLPASPEDVPQAKLVLTYVAVFFFSVFMLNVFIGIISAQVALEKERADLSIQLLRADRCQDFLVRTLHVPCGVMSRHVAAATLVAAVLGILALNILGLTRKETLPWSVAGYAVCMALVRLAAFQNPDAPWAQPKSQRERSQFLWFAERKTSSP